MLGALLSIALELGSTEARGLEPDAPVLRVAWDAPQGRCPNAVEVQRRLAARLPGHRVRVESARSPGWGGQVPVIRAVISGQPGAWRAELQRAGAGGSSLRRLQDPSCPALSEALILVLGLAFEAEQQLEPPPRLPPASQVPEPAPERPRSASSVRGTAENNRTRARVDAGPPAGANASGLPQDQGASDEPTFAPGPAGDPSEAELNPEATETRQSRRTPQRRSEKRRSRIDAPWQWHAEADAAFGLGVFEGAAWSVRGALGFGRGRLWGQIAGQFWLPDTVSNGTRFEVQLTRWTTAARICFSPLQKAVELATCAAFEAGATQISPKKNLLARPSEPDAAQLAGLLGLRLLVPVAVARRTRVETVLTLSAEVGYSALARPFITAPSGTVVFPAQPVFGVLAIGCLWRGGS